MEHRPTDASRVSWFDDPTWCSLQHASRYRRDWSVNRLQPGMMWSYALHASTINWPTLTTQNKLPEKASTIVWASLDCFPVFILQINLHNESYFIDTNNFRFHVLTLMVRWLLCLETWFDCWACAWITYSHAFAELSAGTSLDSFSPFRAFTLVIVQKCESRPTNRPTDRATVTSSKHTTLIVLFARHLFCIQATTGANILSATWSAKLFSARPLPNSSCKSRIGWSILFNQIFSLRCSDDLSQHVRETGIQVKLVTFLANHDPSAEQYAKVTEKSCKESGILFELRKLNRESLEDAIIEANDDDSIHGILVYYPVFGGGHDQYIQNCVSPHKDVEGLCHLYRFNMYHNIRHIHGRKDLKSIIPCTPLAVIKVTLFEFCNTTSTDHVMHTDIGTLQRVRRWCALR